MSDDKNQFNLNDLYNKIGVKIVITTQWKDKFCNRTSPANSTELEYGCIFSALTAWIIQCLRHRDSCAKT